MSTANSSLALPTNEHPQPTEPTKAPAVADMLATTSCLGEAIAAPEGRHCHCRLMVWRGGAQVSGSGLTQRLELHYITRAPRQPWKTSRPTIPELWRHLGSMFGQTNVTVREPMLGGERKKTLRKQNTSTKFPGFVPRLSSDFVYVLPLPANFFLTPAQSRDSPGIFWGGFFPHNAIDVAVSASKVLRHHDKS